MRTVTVCTGNRFVFVDVDQVFVQYVYVGITTVLKYCIDLWKEISQIIKLIFFIPGIWKSTHKLQTQFSQKHKNYWILSFLPNTFNYRQICVCILLSTLFYRDFLGASACFTYAPPTIKPVPSIHIAPADRIPAAIMMVIRTGCDKYSISDA